MLHVAKSALLVAASLTSTFAAATEVVMRVAPPRLELAPDQVLLKNDSMPDEGGNAALQLGFVTGEMAGVWVRVPAEYEYFKVDYFRVLIGGGDSEVTTQGFFQMAVADEPSQAIPGQLQNAVQVTSGAFWNDIPAQGSEGQTLCATGGQVVGAAFEFTHDGAPSVYRDLDGISEVKYNTLMAIPGGWNYSAAFGLRGDWVLRIVGHKATAEECAR